MKKIFLFFATVCAIVACDPTHEDISNGGHITADELKAMSTVTLDKDPATGKNGNVLTCTTSAPVNAKWTVAGKDLVGNYAKKKMRLGDYTIILTGLCADGTEVEDPVAQPEFWLEANGDGAPGRFSDNEGKYFPYLDDDTYFGHKTLVFEVTETEEGKFIWGDDYGLTCRLMTGWWSPTFADNVVPTSPYWEVDITEDMAKACAKGGEAKDLDILMTRGKIKIKACYYEY